MKVSSEKWIMVCAQVLYGVALGGLVLITMKCSDPLQIIGNLFAGSPPKQVAQLSSC